MTERLLAYTDSGKLKEFSEKERARTEKAIVAAANNPVALQEIYDNPPAMTVQEALASNGITIRPDVELGNFALEAANAVVAQNKYLGGQKPGYPTEVTSVWRTRNKQKELNLKVNKVSPDKHSRHEDATAWDIAGKHMTTEERFAFGVWSQNNLGFPRNADGSSSLRFKHDYQDGHIHFEYKPGTTFKVPKDK